VAYIIGERSCRGRRRGRTMTNDKK